MSLQRNSLGGENITFSKFFQHGRYWIRNHILIREGIRRKLFYRTQVFLGSDLWVRVSLTHSLTHSLMFVNFVDGATLADEDLNTN